MGVISPYRTGPRPLRVPRSFSVQERTFAIMGHAIVSEVNARFNAQARFFRIDLRGVYNELLDEIGVELRTASAHQRGEFMEMLRARLERLRGMPYEELRRNVEQYYFGRIRMPF